jgi:hypothetical protein
MATFAPRPNLHGLLVGALAAALDPAQGVEPGHAPTPTEHRRATPDEYLGVMSLCESAGISGDAADGCPYAGTDDCTCDQEGA